MNDERKTMSELVKSVKGKPYSKEFWEKVVKNIREENERYERQCESMMIDPISGKSTASWEYMQKRFTV